MKRSISIIGSFKQHNEQIQRLCSTLRAAGIIVTSPQGDDVIQEGIDFVRFRTDDPAWSDPAVQSLALHRILRSDLVYVVLPEGYIGRTTCYEIGRVVQAKRPIYFSHRPLDLPIHVPEPFVLDEASLLAKLIHADWQPDWLFSNDDDRASELEQELAAGTFRDE